jgi:demethylmenaquinone methyltransferase/2-methoxy-6-polyprenyl-1,4-benzoquinol methylase
VVDKEQGVKEFARILKNGGLFCMLEFTKDESKNPLNKMAQWYVRTILPILGGIISGNMGAYKYLPDSIENFLTRAQIEDMLIENGFEIEFARDFSFGISSLVIARKK